MPPKQAVSFQQVEDVAFEIVRSNGLAALNVRRIAEQLNVSTQPIYTACQSMSRIEEAISQRVRSFAREFLSHPVDGEPELLQLGFRSIAFAKEEPHLYAILAANMRASKTEMPPWVLERFKSEPRLRCLSTAQLRRLHALLWTFSLGIASQITEETSARELRGFHALLREAGEAFIAHATGQ